MNDFIDYFIKKQWLHGMVSRLTPKYHKTYAAGNRIKSPRKKVLLKKIFFQSLRDLENWSIKFWNVDAADITVIFAQKGYEDKGYGHTKRIISNVADLLEKHCQLVTGLGPINNDRTSTRSITKGIQIEKEYFESLRPTIALFYCTAYIHDVGMKFAGMYEPLSALIKAGGESAIHVSTIIHNYHNYSIFILMIELFHMQIKNGKWPKKGSIDWDKDTVYLKYLFTNNPEKSEKEITEGKALATLTTCLQSIFENHFKKDFPKLSARDFFVILAILCLFHQETKPELVQSIIRKYKAPKYQETVECINGWLDFFKRMDEWTKNIKQYMPIPMDKNFSGCEQIILRGNNNVLLDLHLAEALLQYGDKTEISMARLSRKIGVAHCAPEIPLNSFLEDCQYDNQKGFICMDMARRKISNFARFRACRFIPVLYVDVVEDATHTRKNLNIFIHYLRFGGDGTIFKYLRFKNEKDFHDLDFLNSLQIHLPMVLRNYHLNQVNKRNTIPIITFTLRRIEHDFFEQYDDLLKILKDKQYLDSLQGIKKINTRIINERNANISKDICFPYTKENRIAIIENCMEILNPEAKNKSQGKTEVFELAGDMVIPTSFEVMAILNLFQQES